jgi:hypothetical protein
VSRREFWGFFDPQITQINADFVRGRTTDGTDGTDGPENDEYRMAEGKRGRNQTSNIKPQTSAEATALGTAHATGQLTI